MTSPYCRVDRRSAGLPAGQPRRAARLTERLLLDAVAGGQVMPGPVFTTVTFIGLLLAGPAGTAEAAAGIFLPAFFFVAASVLLLPRLRRSAATSAYLHGVNVASLALMVVVTLAAGSGGHRRPARQPPAGSAGIAPSARAEQRSVAEPHCSLSGKAYNDYW